jgi:predicted tellurium resistance membrane protein TerC
LTCEVVIKKQAATVTNLPLSPTEERRVRMIKYSVAMGIRLVCIVLMLFVHDWWLILCAVGAIVLPYFAMIIANVSTSRHAGVVERPSSIVRVESHLP